MRDVIEHYDKLIEENNDPARDPKPLKDYMDKWDGKQFIESMQLDNSKSVLEIGVGTGRIALKVALCVNNLLVLIFPKKRFCEHPKIYLPIITLNLFVMILWHMNL